MERSGPRTSLRHSHGTSISLFSDRVHGLAANLDTIAKAQVRATGRTATPRIQALLVKDVWAILGMWENCQVAFVRHDPLAASLCEGKLLM